MSCSNKLCPFHTSSRAIRPTHLHDEILGIRVFDKGKLNLEQFSDQLPLEALSPEIIAFIQAQSGGGGSVADASNLNGTATIDDGNNSDLVAEVGKSDWKIRGFYVSGKGEGIITLTYTTSAGVVVITDELSHTSRRVHVSFPSPDVITNLTNVTLNIENNSGDNDVDYFCMIFGEDVV